MKISMLLKIYRARIAVYAIFIVMLIVIGVLTYTLVERGEEAEKRAIDKIEGDYGLCKEEADKKYNIFWNDRCRVAGETDNCELFYEIAIALHNMHEEDLARCDTKYYFSLENK